MRVSPEVIRSVQEAVDIVDVISGYMALKPSGSSLKGLCPFHEEKTPSFHVFPQSQRFKCFGCGEGGDVFQFLMQHANLGFLDALEELARGVGISLPSEDEDPAEGERRQRRSEILGALEFARGFFTSVLERPVATDARAYLAQRSFQPNTVSVFGLGYSPDEFQAFGSYARSKGFRDEILFDAGLLRRKEDGRPYDMFRGRIMFPIRDVRGQVIGFGARALGDGQPKYLNSPDGPLFKKGRELYGLDLAAQAARRTGRLLMVEGYTDVMFCHQAGLQEAVAGLGTALTAENAQRMRRLQFPVVLLYDGDEAGRRAAERAADVLLAESVEGSVALIPAGQDPADLVLAEGPQAIEAVVGKARPLWDYRVDCVLARHDLQTLEGRGTATHELVETISRIAEPLRRDVALRLLSERMGVPESTVRQELGEIRQPRRARNEEGIAPHEVGEFWIRAERELLAAAIQDEAIWTRLSEIYPPGEFRSQELREIATAVGDLRAHGQSVDGAALLARKTGRPRKKTFKG